MKHRPKLTTADKVDIVRRVLVEKEKLADVARAYRVTVPYISSLSTGVQKKKDVFREAYQKQADKELRLNAIRRVVSGMLS